MRCTVQTSLAAICMCISGVPKLTRYVGVIWVTPLNRQPKFEWCVVKCGF